MEIFVVYSNRLQHAPENSTIGNHGKMHYVDISKIENRQDKIDFIKNIGKNFFPITQGVMSCLAHDVTGMNLKTETLNYRDNNPTINNLIELSENGNTYDRYLRFQINEGIVNCESVETSAIDDNDNYHYFSFPFLYGLRKKFDGDKTLQFCTVENGDYISLGFTIQDEDKLYDVSYNPPNGRLNFAQNYDRKFL